MLHKAIEPQHNYEKITNEKETKNETSTLSYHEIYSGALLTLTEISHCQMKINVFYRFKTSINHFHVLKLMVNVVSSLASNVLEEPANQ